LSWDEVHWCSDDDGGSISAGWVLSGAGEAGGCVGAGWVLSDTGGQCQGVVLLLVLGRATRVLIWYHGVVLRMGRGSLVIMQLRGCCWCGAELIWCWRGDEECVLGGSCQALGM